MIAYEDAASAIDWLTRAFGLTEDPGARYTDSDGVVGHAELMYGDETIMLSTPNPEYRNPKHHRKTCSEAAAWLDNPWVIDGVLIQIDDLDAHYQQAIDEGAEIIRPLDDSGMGFRVYSAEDLEGHRWMFVEKS